jgi:hypothetical protein
MWYIYIYIYIYIYRSLCLGMPSSVLYTHTFKHIYAHTHNKITLKSCDVLVGA